jgi:hypothetical protein
MFEIVPNRKLYTLTWMLSALWNNWIILLFTRQPVAVGGSENRVVAASYEARRLGKLLYG